MNILNGSDFLATKHKKSGTTNVAPLILLVGLNVI